MLQKALSDMIGIGSRMPARQAGAWYANVILNFPDILKTRKFYPADNAMSGPVSFFYAGRRFDFDLSKQPVNGFSWLREFFVRDNYFCKFSCDLRQIKTFVDFGCNVGMVSYIIHLLGCRNIVAIDADDHTTSVTRLMIAEQAPEIRFLHALVKSHDNPSFDRATYDAFTKKYGETFNANGASIDCDQLVKMFGEHRIDMVKIDIEGAEFDILLGHQPWLEKVDNITMEVHSGIGNPTKIVDALKVAGFKVARRGNHSDDVPEEKADFIYASRVGWLD